MKSRLGKVGWMVALAALAISASATDVATLRNGFTIRHESRAPLGEVTRLFLTADGSSFFDVPTAEIIQIEKNVGPLPGAEKADPAPVAAVPVLPGTSPSIAVPAPAGVLQKSAAPIDLSHTVNAAGERYRLDPDFINSVIRAESGFKVHAVSPKGAQGLMQLMPGTASKLGVPNAFDPDANVDGGTRYLRELLERYNFDLVKALAAYNAGPHRVDQYHGVPPYRETRHYVASIVRDFNRKKLAQQKATKTSVAATSKTAKTPTATAKTAKPQTRMASAPKQQPPADATSEASASR